MLLWCLYDLPKFYFEVSTDSIEITKKVSSNIHSCHWNFMIKIRTQKFRYLENET